MNTHTDGTLSYTVGSSNNDKGLFATESIPANTILFKITGNLLSFKQAVTLGKNESYCLQIDLNTYIAPHYPFFLSNHSCKPNCAINHKLEFYTLENIEKDTELVWDYSTSMLERHWTMKCNCQSENCRKVIRDFDLLPESIQEKYLKSAIVLPYIVRYLQVVKSEKIKANS